jgi:hypothetical protein
MVKNMQIQTQSRNHAFVTHMYVKQRQDCYIMLCMYVYSRGGPHTAPAPRPSLIYCALILCIDRPVSVCVHMVQKVKLLCHEDVWGSEGIFVFS